MSEVNSRLIANYKDIYCVSHTLGKTFFIILIGTFQYYITYLNCLDILGYLGYSQASAPNR